MTVELSLRDVRAGYGAVEVLHGIGLDVPTGSLTALLGPNGAGKTTLLSAVAGLLPVRSGHIRWADRDIVGTRADELARAGMMLIPQQRGIFTTMSVRDNLEIFAGRGADLHRAFETFPILGQRLHQLAVNLSGGEQQMLAMSRALLGQPRLLLLDEISVGLAPHVTRLFFDVVAQLAESGVTIVLVEQYLSDALRLADVVYVLSRGEVAFAGEPAELEGRDLPGYVVTS